ncbi:DNA-binding protein [Oculatella sp. LEGE 06141]|uniref:DNA-binding protein n=1 Tax=Oculatella sp. LEGE 06141 TaxID=1828648 RepID=UPI001880D10B|nr:DNA-binding protein [Oculatella sp. LEGE 06141]MBE9178607.1 DNA-binding protein [Oculatella sp. LEGE 06141]
MATKPRTSSARTTKTTGSDAIAAGSSEKDAINALNNDKLKRPNGSGDTAAQSDTATETPATPVSVTGSDSANGQPATDSQPLPQMVTLKPEELQALLGDSINTAVNQAIAPIQERLDQTQAQLDATTQQLQSAKDEASRLAGVFQVMGSANPVASGGDRTTVMVNTVTSTRSDKAPGAAADFFDILENSDQTPKYSHENTQGQIVVSKDYTNLKRFVRDNAAAVRKDMEQFAKANGLLRSGMGRDNTTKVTIPDGFLAYLSTVMRLTHTPSFIFHQFVKVKLDMGKGQGDTVKIPRFAYNSAPANSAARKLSGSGTYARITNSRQGLTQGSVSCVLEEWGLGLDNNSPPILIPQFVSANSLLDLEQVLDRNLNYDYQVWEDLTIRGLWDPTSRVVYNDRSSVTATPGDVGAGDDGTLTEGFMDELYSYMRGLQIPTYEDGCYGMATHSKGRSQVRKSLGNRFQFPSEQSIEEVTNILNTANSGEMGKVSGYLGKISNFHIFETNAFSMGAPGTEGVQTETLGAGSRATRTSYAFGSDTIGRGVGQEMEIRRSNDDDFQRSDSYIWRSEEGFCPLDVDPTGYSDASTVPQQLRVIDVRTVDVTL